MPKVLVQAKKPSTSSDFPLEHYSPSSMVKFATNPILFKIEQINGEHFETATGASGVLGSAVHKGLEVYYVGSDTLIPTNEAEAIEYGLKAGMEFLELYNDGFINYSKTIPNKQKLYDLFTFCYQAYIKEMPYEKDSILYCEEGIKEHISVLWRGRQLDLPVPLKGYLDKGKRVDGKPKIVDYKVVYNYSDPDKIDGAKIIQAVCYYLLHYSKFGEEPYSVIFEEIKRTKNSDGSKQVRSYEFVFAENELFFDLFFRLYDDITRALNGEAVFVPNFNALFDNEIAIISYIHRLDEKESVAKLMKKHKVSRLSDLLKKEIQNAGNMRKLLKSVEANFAEAKNINYEAMKNEEKIQTKMLEHGMALSFDSKVEGATVDLYRYNPSIGLKMSRLASFVPDVEQVLGVSGIRILAPIPNSSMVGFEVPLAERRFPTLPLRQKAFEIAIGETLTGEVRWYDIRKAPHILVAGASGSGKSTWLNATITQLAQDGDLYLFDPKIVELKEFAPIAKRYETDADKINEALADLVVEMEERYKELSKTGLRNIEGTDFSYKFVVIDEFGDLVLQNPEGSEKWSFCEEHLGMDSNGDLARVMSTKRRLRVKEQDAKDRVESCELCEKVVIPPFETSVSRLGAKGRAAGIHLIVATQSPRASIIKGAIKANFPVKVVFQVTKQLESVIVIDEPGAEKLKGAGDMLFVGGGEIERLQGYSR